MSLLTVHDATALLVCPGCRGRLRRTAVGLVCSEPSCPCGGDRAFGEVDGQPVLIDPTRSIAPAHADRGGAHGPAAPRGRKPRPRWLRRIFTPYNRVAAEHAARVLGRLGARASRPRLLIVGGGTVGNGAESLYGDPAVDVMAFDLYASPHTQFVADAHSVPLPDASVDAVWVQAVLEHVLDPWRVVGEIHRVLSPDGLVYAETPFLQAVHEGAYDFTRFTESGHRWLFRRFEALDTGVVAGPFLSLAWSIDYAVGGLLHSRLAGRLARAPLFWLPWLDRWVPTHHAVAAASCVYFMGTRSDAELRPREIVEHYMGDRSRHTSS